jgi:kynureninase
MEIDPASLRRHYSCFLHDDRVLLTGHSHQAWPDVAREGLIEAFEDAAALADDKWGRAMAAADDVRAAVASRIGAHADEIALGASTHELVTRLLSALDWRKRKHVVTTAGEFHSLHRQLKRLSEEGIEVSAVAIDPIDTLSERLGAAVKGDTAALMVSTVLFETSAIVPNINHAISIAHRHGATVLLDAYHAFGVVPFSIADYPGPVFVTAGGYKYAQWGEGCCFLRVPPECSLRPVYTGWFSDFAHLAAPRDAAIGYGARPADRFAGSTYDPSSHYRARAVIRFFDANGLSIDRLRALSSRQTSRLIAGLEGFDVRTPREPEKRGGFVSVRMKGADRVVAKLRDAKIFTDSRGEIVRFGPAPYVTDDEIDRALVALRS